MFQARNCVLRCAVSFDLTVFVTYETVFGVYFDLLIHCYQAKSVILIPQIAIQLQMRPMKTVQGIAYVCTERIFDSRLLLYNVIHLIKLQQKCVVHIFTLLLAHFTPKLVSFSSQSEPLYYVPKSTISCLRRKMQSILEFY